MTVIPEISHDVKWSQIWHGFEKFGNGTRLPSIFHYCVITIYTADGHEIKKLLFNFFYLHLEPKWKLRHGLDQEGKFGMELNMWGLWTMWHKKSYNKQLNFQMRLQPLMFRRKTMRSHWVSSSGHQYAVYTLVMIFAAVKLNKRIPQILPGSNTHVHCPSAMYRRKNLLPTFLLTIYMSIIEAPAV